MKKSLLLQTWIDGKAFRVYELPDDGQVIHGHHSMMNHKFDHRVDPSIMKIHQNPMPYSYRTKIFDGATKVALNLPHQVSLPSRYGENRSIYRILILQKRTSTRVITILMVICEVNDRKLLRHTRRSKKRGVVST
jgi:hypothetical protein